MPTIKRGGKTIHLPYGNTKGSKTGKGGKKGK